MSGDAREEVDSRKELADWWRDKAEKDLAMLLPKAGEYGAVDLVIIGQTMARISEGLAGRTLSDDEAAEVGIFMYVVGKMARWEAAIIEGRRPSDDTLLDINVYSRMVERIRVTGGWPHAPKEST